MNISASSFERNPAVESVTDFIEPSASNSGAPQTDVCHRHVTPASSSISRATLRYISASNGTLPFCKSVMAPPRAARRSTNSQGRPSTIRFPAKLNLEIGPTSPAVAMPPGNPNDSTSRTFAPCRAAAIAAINPAGPPPTTHTPVFNVRPESSGVFASAEQEAFAPLATAPHAAMHPRFFTNARLFII